MDEVACAAQTIELLKGVSMLCQLNFEKTAILRVMQEDIEQWELN